MKRAKLFSFHPERHTYSLKSKQNKEKSRVFFSLIGLGGFGISQLTFDNNFEFYENRKLFIDKAKIKLKFILRS